MRLEKTPDTIGQRYTRNRSHPSLEMILAYRNDAYRVTEPETRRLIDAITALTLDQ
ncbi:MAG: hypothetical protein NXI19_07455 [Alphaproteobacteria bacterium]|nr:hypothetical protein [Alphaproteobacteria bacterium]